MVLLRVGFRSLPWAVLVTLFTACSAGGTGVGTALPEPQACPTELPSAGSSCSSLQLCRYPLCADGAPCAVTHYAYCPGGSTAVWQVEALDGGVVLDTSAETREETHIDAPNDVFSDTFDAADAMPDSVNNAASEADVNSDSSDTIEETSLDATQDVATDGTTSNSDGQADSPEDSPFDVLTDSPPNASDTSEGDSDVGDVSQNG